MWSCQSSLNQVTSNSITATRTTTALEKLFSAHRDVLPAIVSKIMVDISDYRDDIWDHLEYHGWEESDDRDSQGVYYRNDGQQATLTIWYQTGKYRTTLDKGVHPSGKSVQMYNKTDSMDPYDIFEEIKDVAEDVRYHTNNRYSDQQHSTIKCHKCGEVGHRKVDCPNAFIVCYACGEPGHESSSCPN